MFVCYERGGGGVGVGGAGLYGYLLALGDKETKHTRSTACSVPQCPHLSLSLQQLLCSFKGLAKDLFPVKDFIADV